VNPDSTLVIGSCDPAAGLLAEEYARVTGFRLLVLSRTSRQALSLLAQGLLHAAGVHFATPDEPDRNARSVLEILGPQYRLLRVADWEAGLAVTPGSGVSTVREAVRAKLRWVGREPGSAARQCLDELLPTGTIPKRVARDHHGVAEAVRCGWADIGVCHRLAGEEAGLRFLPVRQELFDLCYPAAAEGDPRIAALFRVVRSEGFRRLLGEVPGFDTRRAGDVIAVR
jgi:molybdate-binding protein